MTPDFRTATRADVPAILDLLREDDLGAARETAPDAQYLERFDTLKNEPPTHLIVGEMNASVIACYLLTVVGGLSLQGGIRGQIEDVRVARALRGKGIGHLMLADAEARARTLGCRMLQLVAHESRTDAHRFYRSLGFVPTHIGFKRPL